MSDKRDRENRAQRLQALISLAADKQGACGPCPDPETLARFVDGQLPDVERQHVQHHLADCQDCYRIWLSAAEDAETVVRAPGMRSKRGGKLILGYIGTALAAAASVALYLNLQGTSKQAMLMREDVAPQQTIERAAGGQITASRLESDKEMSDAEEEQFEAQAEAPEADELGNIAKPLPPSPATLPQSRKVDSVSKQKAESVAEPAPSVEIAPETDVPSSLKTTRQKTVSEPQGMAAPAPPVADGIQRVLPPKKELDEKSTAISATAENVARKGAEDRSAENLTPFYAKITNLCTAQTSRPANWEELYREVQELSAAQVDPVSQEKLRRIRGIIRVITVSQDAAAGCRQLQGVLAEEGGSR